MSRITSFRLLIARGKIIVNGTIEASPPVWSPFFPATSSVSSTRKIHLSDTYHTMLPTNPAMQAANRNPTNKKPVSCQSSIIAPHNRIKQYQVSALSADLNIPCCWTSSEARNSQNTHGKIVSFTSSKSKSKKTLFQVGTIKTMIH